MKQKELSRWLRAIVIVCWVGCAVTGIWVAPWAFRQVALADPPSAHLTTFRIVTFWVMLIPVIVALWQGWRIFGDSGRDNSFGLENARRLKGISYHAAGDTILVRAYSLALVGLNALYPAQIVLHLGVLFIGVAVTVAAAALSHLTHKAAVLQDENELTI